MITILTVKLDDCTGCLFSHKIDEPVRALKWHSRVLFSMEIGNWRQFQSSGSSEISTLLIGKRWSSDSRNSGV
jgi:hypothetical protein